MRKLELSLACLLINLLSFAQVPSQGIQLLHVTSDSLKVAITQEKVKLDRSDRPIAKPQKLRSTTKSESDELAGYYFSYDYSDPVTVSRKYVVRIESNTDGTVTLHNLMGAQQAIKGVYDAVAHTLTIAPQVTYIDDTYGSFYCCPVNFTTNTYDPKKNIVATVDNGNIYMPGWGIFILEGANAGKQIVNRKTEMLKTNGFMTDYSFTHATDADSVRTYPIIYSRENNGKIAINNFFNMGRELLMSVDSLGNVSLNRQTVAISGVTNFYNYSLSSYTDATTMKLVSTPTPGVFSGDSIVIDKWALSKSTAVSGVYEAIRKSVLHVPDVFSNYSNKITLKGSGTAEDPYLIEGAEDLVNLSTISNHNSNYVVNKSVFNGYYFKQTKDIDMSSVTNFEPICLEAANAFEGNYDGGNFTISNLKINQRDAIGAGFFGVLGKNSIVKNIIFDGPKISSTRTQVGTLAGSASGVIDNIIVKNGYISDPYIYVGGIVGLHYGKLTNSHFSGNIYAQSFVGGIIGSCYGEVDNVWSDATINITATTASAGGIAGAGSRSEASISDSYFIGSIKDSYGESCVGGIIGYAYLVNLKRCWNGGDIASIASSSAKLGNAGGMVGKMIGGSIIDCINTGIINGVQITDAGGLVGLAIKGASGTVNESDAPIIKNSLATSYIMTGSQNDGCELIGTIDGEVSLINSYFDNQANYIRSSKNSLTTAQLTSGNPIDGFDNQWSFSKGKYPQLTKFVALNKAVLDATPFTLASGDNAMHVTSDFTIDNSNGVVWKLFHNLKYQDTGKGLEINGGNVKFIATSIVSDTIVAFKGDDFKFYVLKVIPDVFEGKGTVDSPYLIKTKDDLIKIDDAINKVLIDFRGTYFAIANDIDMSSGSDFIGIAKAGINHGFNGNFDGKGYYIKNWKLNRTIDSNGVLLSTAQNLLAGLFIYVGENAVIKNVKIDKSCEVVTGSYSGMIASYNAGTIENCRNYGQISTIYRGAGGIVGYNAEKGRINNCYNVGSVKTGMLGAGGIVGYNYGLVSRSQNDGDIDCKIISDYCIDESKIYSAGGIVGDNYGTIYGSLNQGWIHGLNRNGGIAGTAQSTTKITNCLNTGIIALDKNGNLHGAMMGYNYAKTDSLSNNYYDSQISSDADGNNKALDGVDGLTTTTLTSGNPIENFDNEGWVFESGSYPVLANFANETASQVYSKSYIKFATGDKNDTRFAIRKDAILMYPEGATATLSTATDFKINDKSLILTTPLGRAAMDTLTIRKDSYVKVYPLNANPKVLAKGDGSKENPWLIETIDDMNDVAQFSLTYNDPFIDEYFKLVNNLDFKNIDYIPIASNGTTVFQGYFDGNEKTISNLSYYNGDLSTGTYKGIFGKVGDRGVIADLTVDSSCSISAYQYVGGISGACAGTILRCKNQATVATTKMGYAGGITGYAYSNSQFKNCINNGKVTSLNGQGGGIVGCSDANVELDSCTNTGNIAAKYTVGGIIGSSKGSIYNCNNSGEITSDSYYAGGIVGYQNAECVISNSHNSGRIHTVTYNAGGVAGYLATAATVIDCTNSGDVEAETIKAAGIVGSLNKAGAMIVNCTNSGFVYSHSTDAGGIVGATTGSTILTTEIRNCVNKGSILSDKYYVGGIAGELKAHTNAINCINMGEVLGNNQVGGIAGTIYGKVDSCYNEAPVSGIYSIGGIGGNVPGELYNSFNVGAISTTGSATTSYNIGGLIGTGKGTVINAYNVSDITGYKNTGGLIGLPVKGNSSAVGTNVTNAYNVGNVECLVESNIANCGNIMGSTGLAYITFNNVFFDGQRTKTTFANDNVGVKLNTSEITSTPLPSEWTMRENCYPVLTCFADSSVAKIYSAAIVLSSGDALDNISKDFKIGVPDGVEWSSSSAIEIDGGNVKLANTTSGVDATLTAKIGKYTKTYNLYITGVSGIADTLNEEDILTIKYISPNGVEYSSPVQGINIKKIIYRNGRVEISKVVE